MPEILEPLEKLVQVGMLLHSKGEKPASLVMLTAEGDLNIMPSEPSEELHKAISKILGRVIQYTELKQYIIGPVQGNNLPRENSPYKISQLFIGGSITRFTLSDQSGYTIHEHHDSLPEGYKEVISQPSLMLDRFSEIMADEQKVED